MIPWSVKSLRKAIGSCIAVQENVQHYVSTNNPNVRGQSFASRQTRSQPDSQRPFTEILATNVQRKSAGTSNQTKASLSCLFCRGYHFNDMCDKYITLAGENKYLISSVGVTFV